MLRGFFVLVTDTSTGSVHELTQMHLFMLPAAAFDLPQTQRNTENNIYTRCLPSVFPASVATNICEANNDNPC